MLPVPQIYHWGFLVKFHSTNRNWTQRRLITIRNIYSFYVFHLLRNILFLATAQLFLRIRDGRQFPKHTTIPKTYPNSHNIPQFPQHTTIPTTYPKKWTCNAYFWPNELNYVNKVLHYSKEHSLNPTKIMDPTKSIYVFGIILKLLCTENIKYNSYLSADDILIFLHLSVYETY